LIPFTLHPEEVNLPTYSNEAIRGGSAQRNAEILLDVLKGKPGAYLDTVLLNAGLGLFANGTVNTIQDGVLVARQSIQSGAAIEKLQRLVDYSQQVIEVV